MRKIIQSTNFWLWSGFISSVVFLYLVNSSQTYKSQTDIMILPKSQVAAENFDQIIENSKVIVRALSFYDSMIYQNRNIEDGSQTFSLGKRKKYWADKVKVERIGNSGVISILIYEDYINQAGILGEQSAKTLRSELGKIYKIDEDISLISVDSTTISEEAKFDIITLILESLALGFLISVVINYIHNLIKGIKLSLKIDFKFPKKALKTEIFPWKNLEIMKKDAKEVAKKEFDKKSALDPDQDKQREMIENIIKQKIEEEQKKKTQEIKTIIPDGVSKNKKSEAPMNLPVFEDDKTKEVESDQMSEKESQSDNKEATLEEIKERLNKLLGGKL